MKRIQAVVLLASLACLPQTACRQQQPALGITEKRAVPVSDLPAQASDKQRFGWEQGMPGTQQAGDPHAGMTSGTMAAPAASGLPSGPQLAFDFKLPNGWREVTPTQFRNPNLVLGEGGAGQCYVTVLGGTAGGAAMNINRWRGQMGLPPMPENEMADLPTLPFLGKTATYVELAGDFKGMMGQGDLAGAMMIGLLGESDGHAVFVKAVGPKALMAAERDHFKTFCTSLTPKAAPAGGDPGDMSQAPLVPPAEGLPAGHPPISGAMAQPGAAPAQSSGPTNLDLPGAGSGADRLTWTPPAGWETQPGQPMRAASFKIKGAAGDADCGVFLLPGAAGGVAANINRWRRQMEMEPLDESAFAKLPTTEIAGQQGKLVELSGSYKGMSDKAQAGSELLGVICEVAGDSLFVKLTGPKATVQQARPAFLQFCRELKTK